MKFYIMKKYSYGEGFQLGELFLTAEELRNGIKELISKGNDAAETMIVQVIEPEIILNL